LLRKFGSFCFHKLYAIFAIGYIAVNNQTCPQVAITRRQLEAELLNTLSLRQEEWFRATDSSRANARESYARALAAFDELVLYDRIPAASRSNLPIEKSA
jgi:hypothetical protein